MFALMQAYAPPPGTTAKSAEHMNTAERNRRRPALVWLAAALHVVFAVSCVDQFVSIGEPLAFVFAAVCGTLPLVTWCETSRLRGRGHSRAAERVLAAAVGLQALRGMFAMYATQLAELATSCGCPP
jgi:hypothetical protein